jgi:Acetyl-CoA acetyltransferase
MSDGAGALLLVDEDTLKKYNMTPIAVFHGFSVAGVPPEIMGIGPIKAIPKVLEQTGIKLDDIEWIELNEAFAAQSLAVIREVGLKPGCGQPQWRCHCLGPPSGRHRRHPLRHRHSRLAPNRREIRFSHHVYRYRYGCSGFI